MFSKKMKLAVCVCVCFGILTGCSTSSVDSKHASKAKETSKTLVDTKHDDKENSSTNSTGGKENSSLSDSSVSSPAQKNNSSKNTNKKHVAPQHVSKPGSKSNTELRSDDNKKNGVSNSVKVNKPKKHSQPVPHKPAPAPKPQPQPVPHKPAPAPKPKPQPVHKPAPPAPAPVAPKPQPKPKVRYANDQNISNASEIAKIKAYYQRKGTYRPFDKKLCQVIGNVSSSGGFEGIMYSEAHRNIVNRGSTFINPRFFWESWRNGTLMIAVWSVDIVACAYK